MQEYVYIALAAAAVILLFILGYLKAPPDTAYIISGLGKKRILIGRAGWRIPFLERVDRLSLRVMQVDVKTSEAVPTNEFINVMVDGVANVKISSDTELLTRAAESLLGMRQPEMISLITQVLEGNMREIVGSVGLKEMVQDRQGVAKKITENVVPDMDKLGIEVVNFNIQNFKDNAGTIENMGIDNVEQIRKNAAIAKANAQRDIAIASANAQQEANAVKVTAGCFQVAGRRGAGGHYHGVVVMGQLVNICGLLGAEEVARERLSIGLGSVVYLYAKLEDNALFFQQIHAAVDDRLVELEVGDAVAHESAGILAGLKYGNLITALVKLCGHAQAGRPCADDGHAFAVALRMEGMDEILGEGVLGNGTFVLADSCRLVIHQVEHAGLFTQCRTDAAGELGEVVGLVDELVGQFPVALVNGVVPLRRAVSQRTGPVAEGHAAVHAAGGLLASVLPVEGLFHLCLIIYSFAHGTIAGIFPGDRHKCFRVSHTIVFCLPHQRDLC